MGRNNSGNAATGRTPATPEASPPDNVPAIPEAIEGTIVPTTVAEALDLIGTLRLNSAGEFPEQQRGQIRAALNVVNAGSLAAFQSLEATEGGSTWANLVGYSTIPGYTPQVLRRSGPDAGTVGDASPGYISQVRLQRDTMTALGATSPKSEYWPQVKASSSQSMRELRRLLGKIDSGETDVSVLRAALRADDTRAAITAAVDPGTPAVLAGSEEGSEGSEEGSGASADGADEMVVAKRSAAARAADAVALLGSVWADLSEDVRADLSAKVTALIGADA